MLDATALETLNASLEAVAQVCEDLAPAVYERFFQAHPEARTLFRLDERTRGRMLNEILAVLIELAQDHDYMPATIEGLAKDHTSYGDIPLNLYRGLLEALLGAMSDLLGAGWTDAYEAAWRAQADRLVALVAGSLAEPPAARSPQAAGA